MKNFWLNKSIQKKELKKIIDYINKLLTESDLFNATKEEQKEYLKLKGD